MKNLRMMTLLTAAVLGLGTSLPAQQADSTHTEGTDRPMPMMEQGGMEQDSGMDAMMPMMKMMRHYRTMMMKKTDSGGMDMDDMSGMHMGAMPMMSSGDGGAGHALRHRDRLDLTEEQVRALRKLEEETRAERRAAMKRMREAHEAMRTAATREREQTREILTSEQRKRLTAMSAASSMEDCPMRKRGTGAEPDSTSSAGDGS